MEVEEALQLRDRLLVIVDPQVDDGIAAPVARPSSHHVEAGRLLAPSVSAGGLARLQRLEETLGQRASRRRHEGLGHGVDGCLRDQDVALHRVAGAGAAPRPVGTVSAGVGAGAAHAVDDAQLALGTPAVGTDQPVDGLTGAPAFTQQAEAVGSEGGVYPGLGRNRAHLGLGPRAQRSNREEPGLHGDAPLVTLEVAGHDREGGGRHGCAA